MPTFRAEDFVHPAKTVDVPWSDIPVALLLDYVQRKVPGAEEEMKRRFPDAGKPKAKGFFRTSVKDRDVSSEARDNEGRWTTGGDDGTPVAPKGAKTYAELKPGDRVWGSDYGQDPTVRTVTSAQVEKEDATTKGMIRVSTDDGQTWWAQPADHANIDRSAYRPAWTKGSELIPEWYFDSVYVKPGRLTGDDPAAAAWRSKLSPEDQATMWFWEQAFKNVKGMRQYADDPVAKHFVDLVKSAPEAKGPVYRGVVMGPPKGTNWQDTVDRTLRIGSLASASTDENTAAAFAESDRIGGSNPVVFKMDGGDAHVIANRMNEAVTMPAQWKVTGVETKHLTPDFSLTGYGNEPARDMTVVSLTKVKDLPIGKTARARLDPEKKSLDVERFIVHPDEVVWDPEGKTIFRISVKYDDSEPRDDHGRWTSGGGGAGTLNKVAEPITSADLYGPGKANSRAVSHEEFQQLAAEGKQQMDEIRGQSKNPNGLTNHWDRITEAAWNEVQKPWGGATFDAHSGRQLPQGINAFALSTKPDDVKTVSVPEYVSRAGFLAAMDQAKEQFREELSHKYSHLGVFHDDDNHRIDIDPVTVVGSLHDAEAIGAYTHAVGGAYSFKDGNGYWPPHVEDQEEKDDTPKGHHWKGPGEWRSFAEKVQHGNGQAPLDVAKGMTAKAIFRTSVKDEARDEHGRWTSGGEDAQLPAGWSHERLTNWAKSNYRKADKREFALAHARALLTGAKEPDPPATLSGNEVAAVRWEAGKYVQAQLEDQGQHGHAQRVQARLDDLAQQMMQGRNIQPRRR